MTDKQRDKSGRFRKGKSGNPQGRPRSESAELRQRLATHGPEIADAVISAAKSGDMAAAKIVFERIVPALKTHSPPVQLDLPEEPTMADIGRAVMGACANGQTSPESMSAMLNALSSLARILEVTELETRIAALEAKQ